MVYVDREKMIEDLLCRFPSLFDIAPSHEILRQHKYPDGSQADVVFRWPYVSLVVEIKNDPLHLKDLNQLRKYLIAESKERSLTDVRGLLLGNISTKSEALQRCVEDWSMKITILYAECDFMLQVKYCRECKQPFWASGSKCPRCFSSDFVVVDFAAGGGTAFV